MKKLPVPSFFTATKSSGVGTRYLSEVIAVRRYGVEGSNSEAARLMGYALISGWPGSSGRVWSILTFYGPYIDTFMAYIAFLGETLQPSVTGD
jgi:hypothetical protein